LFIIKNGTNQILDVNKVIISLRKLQEENRIFINADHGIKFKPIFNSIIDKDRTLLKIDLTAENTRWVINDPEILKSIEESSKKDINNILDEKIEQQFQKKFEEKSKSDEE
jgi:hypothetical protein